MKHLILICMLALISSLAMADGMSGKNGYVTDRSGNFVRDNYGACLHSKSWMPSMAIPECEPSAMKKHHRRSTAYSGPNSWEKSTND